MSDLFQFCKFLDNMLAVQPTASFGTFTVITECEGQEGHVVCIVESIIIAIQDEGVIAEEVRINTYSQL